jgi:zinc D-Ala-D-Ala carboxypeptidase
MISFPTFSLRKAYPSCAHAASRGRYYFFGYGRYDRRMRGIREVPAFAILALSAALAASCTAQDGRRSEAPASPAAKSSPAPAAEAGPALPSGARAALDAALPAEAAREARAKIEASPARFSELLAAALADRAADPMLLYRADKAKALPEGYEPADLVALDGTGLSVGRQGQRLRRPAFEAMRAMDAAARAGGVTLLVSSTYRSYAYQAEVFARNVKESGREAALMVSAEPGHSQHQLGTAIDFGSITDAFAGTKAGRWLLANAPRFGFSLSFPKGMEAVTGYSWESWHYRYIGKAAAAMAEEFFGGAQRHALMFLEAYRG